jgi:hypothetical protein
MLKYDFVITRTLISCPEAKIVRGKLDPESLKIKFKNMVEATPLYTEGESYVVDYESLNKPFKQASFSIEYHDKSMLLKSINASADDQLGPVIKDVIKTAIAVSSAAAGAPTASVASILQSRNSKMFMGEGLVIKIPPLAPHATVQAVDCTADTRAEVASLKLKKDAVADATDALELLTKQVADTALRATLKLIHQDKDRIALINVLNRQNAKAGEIDALNKEIADIEESLTIAESRRWPNTFNDYKTTLEVDPADVEAFSKKFAIHAVSRENLPAQQNPACIEVSDSIPDVSKCLAALLTMHADIIFADCVTAPVCRPTGSDEQNNVTPKVPAGAILIEDSKTYPGIFAREPVAGRLLICNASNPCLPAGDLSKQPVASFPQLGQLRFLKFTNGPFESNQLGIVMREDGTFEKIEYKKTGDAAVGLAATAADVASQIKEAKEERQKAKQDAVKNQREELAAQRKEKTDALQYQIDVLNKQKDLLAAQKQDSDQDAVKEQTARIETQVALLKAQLARKEAEAALAAKDEGATKS